MFKRLLGVGGAICVVAFFGAFFSAPSLHAAGETYTWLDYSTIGARGGEYLKTIDDGAYASEPLKFVQKDDNSAVFEAELNVDDCEGRLILTLSSTVKSQATVSGTGDCPLASNLTRSITIAGETTINSKANEDSQLMRDLFINTTCGADQGYSDEEKELCRESATVRHEQVADTCRVQHDFTTRTHLANDYLDCIAEALGVERPGGEDPEEPAETASTTCAIKEVGWMVCQVLQFTAWITDRAFDLLSVFLQVEPLKQYADTSTAVGTSPVDSPLYSAWKVALGFANVVFVFVFIFLIFSYITNQGLSNYSIKTIGPRLIIASLLVNLSFFICGVAVDFSNILGGTLRTTLVDMTPPSTRSTYKSWTELTESIIAITPTDDRYNEKNNLENEEEEGAAGGASEEESETSEEDAALMPAPTVAIFSGVTLAGGAVLMANLSVLVPFMVAALAAIITVLILLVIRQAVIICLIMIAPIAFALIILPNTKQWFDRWADLFTKFLILYPAVSLVFGASYLASSVVGAQAAQNSQSFLAMFALGIQLIPLFITPLILKLSGGLLDRFAGIVNNPNKGPLDRMKNRAKEFRQDRKTQQQGNSAASAGGFKPDPNKGVGRNALGRAKHLARKPNAALQRRKMRSDAAHAAVASKLEEAKSEAFGDRDSILSAAKGIKDGDFRDSLIEESLAYAAKGLDDVEVDRVKSTVARFEQQGLSGTAARAMAMSGEDENGKALTDVEHAAAMQMAANAATSEQAHALIADSGGKSDLVRRTLADSLRKSGFSKENTHFGGAALNGVAEGKFNSQADVDNLIVNAARGSKYGVNTLANQSSHTVDRINTLIDSGQIDIATAAQLRQTADTSLRTPQANAAIKTSAREGIERMAR